MCWITKLSCKQFESNKFRTLFESTYFWSVRVSYAEYLLTVIRSGGVVHQPQIRHQMAQTLLMRVVNAGFPADNDPVERPTEDSLNQCEYRNNSQCTAHRSLLCIGLQRCRPVSVPTFIAKLEFSMGRRASEVDFVLEENRLARWVWFFLQWIERQGYLGVATLSMLLGCIVYKQLTLEKSSRFRWPLHNVHCHIVAHVVR